MENKFKIGDLVCKPEGYKYNGVVVSVFKTTEKKVRYVVENIESKGMLHIFSENQLADFAAIPTDKKENKDILEKKHNSIREFTVNKRHLGFSIEVFPETVICDSLETTCYLISFLNASKNISIRKLVDLANKNKGIVQKQDIDYIIKNPLEVGDYVLKKDNDTIKGIVVGVFSKVNKEKQYAVELIRPTQGSVLIYKADELEYTS